MSESTWVIILGGEPAVKVQAPTITQAAADFIEQSYPQHKGKHVTMNFYERLYTLYAEVEDVRFRVVSAGRLAA